MFRRKGKDGKRGGPYYIIVAGRKITSGTTDRERAKRLQTKLNQEAWDRQNGLEVQTWKDAVLQWGRDNLKAANVYLNSKMARWWYPHLEGRRLDKIDAHLIHTILSSHRKVSLDETLPGNITANQYVAFVKRVIRHRTNLNPKFQVYPTRNIRDRHLTPEEWFRMVPHFTQDERDIFTFLLATGLREANVMLFHADWQDGASAVIPARNTKSAVPYGIPLNKTAQSVLKRRQESPVRHLERVFTDQGSPWYTVKLLRVLKRVCKASEVPYITVHGFRHTFVTWLAKNGVPREIRMRLACHAAQSVHDGYTHFDVESLRPYSEIIDRILSGSGAVSSHSKNSA